MPRNTSSAAASVGPEINRRNSARISARSKCLLLPSSVPTHGPRQKPAASGRLLSRQRGWGKWWAASPDRWAGGRAGSSNVLGCKSRSRAQESTLCSKERVVADAMIPLEALSCLVIHHPGKRQPFHTWHELFNSF